MIEKIVFCPEELRRQRGLRQMSDAELKFKLLCLVILFWFCISFLVFPCTIYIDTQQSDMVPISGSYEIFWVCRCLDSKEAALAGC